MSAKLYLHCGMYKTGSSFLQTMFVRNRDLLKTKGIHYPKSEQELEMYEGKITPGNGVHLSDILTESETDITKLLSGSLVESRKMGMESVLYSSELLFHSFVEKGTVYKLQNAAKAAGFEEISALVYFRDPVSHALSTYKHRAKYGDHQDFSFWLEEKYEIFDLLSAFLEYSKITQIHWTCRRYNPDSTYMIESTFIDWLNIEAPDTPQNDRVNRSLQLNEIKILQSLKKTYPGCENFLREALLSLQAEDKESDKAFEEEYSYLVAEKWCNYRAIFNSLNKLMKEDEKLILESVNRSYESEPLIALSEKQVQAVAVGMENYLKSHRLLYRLADICKRGINKIKRKILASKISFKFLKI